MPTYNERAQLIKALSEQQYFDALKEKEQNKDVRIGDRIGNTGRYQVLSADGGVASNGVKTFNASLPSDGFVRGTKGGNTIALDHRNIKRAEPKRKVEEIEATLPLAFTTLISDQDGFNLKIAGDRDVPEKVFIPDGFELVSIANFKKEGDSVSYDAIYRKETAQRFFKQVSLTRDPFDQSFRIKEPIVQYANTIPSPVSCRVQGYGGIDQGYFVTDDFAFEQNAEIIFIGQVPPPVPNFNYATIQSSVVGGVENIYYISNDTTNGNSFLPNERSFFVSRIPSGDRIFGMSITHGEFFVARSSRSQLKPLKKYTLRVSKVVDGQEESFVEIPDIYEEGNGDNYTEIAVTVLSPRNTEVKFNGGVVGVYGDLCVFWKYEYFQVRNFSSSIFVGFVDSYIKATVGYANLTTKEIVLNYKNIDLRLLVNGRDIKKEPIDYPISWDGTVPTFLPTVFALRQSFKIDNGVISRAIDFGFWTSYVATNTDSILINYSNGVFTDDSETDKDGFIIFDDLKYRLYTGANFEVLPRNFFELPIPTKTVDGKVVEDTEKYFKDIETFFDKSPSSFFNGLKSYLPWLQLTEDLTIVLFVGQPTDIVEVDIGGGQKEMRRLPVDGKILYITRTTENKFEGEFIEEEYLTFEKPLGYTPNFKNITIEKV